MSNETEQTNTNGCGAVIALLIGIAVLCFGLYVLLGGR